MKYLLTTFIVVYFLLQLQGCDIAKEKNMNEIAETYVLLVLQLGKSDPDYVDAYFGPIELKNKAEKIAKKPEDIFREANLLLKDLRKIAPQNKDERFRKKFLVSEIKALSARANIVAGNGLPFASEALELYEVNIPIFQPQKLSGILAEIEDILNKDTSLNGVTVNERWTSLKNRFNVPSNKIDTVFKIALSEARIRTLKKVTLPDNESFAVEMVKDKPWGAYNWFKGNSKSLIQINTGLPISVDRVISLVCHEGYPGHHVFHSLCEKNFVKDRNWVEFSVYPLFSPMSLISEGMANAGVRLCFTPNDKYLYEKNVLLPLLGIDTTGYYKYSLLLNLMNKVDFASIEAAKNYLDRVWSKNETIDFLIKYTFTSKEKAIRYLSFYDQYGSYVVNYSLGQEIIEEYLLKITKNSQENSKLWKAYEDLLNRPKMPKELLNDGKNKAN